MRPDMKTVVTEAPRSGSHNKSLKTGRRLSKNEYDEDQDTGPRRHPISRYSQHGWNAKGFSDVLGPLRRFLRKNVGRPWDKIYSEMTKSLNKRTLTGQHIWTHVDGEVRRYCEVREDGKVYEKKVRRWHTDRPVEGLYIHPVNGLLCYAPEIPWKKKYPEPNRKLMKELKTFGYAFDYSAPPKEGKWIIVGELVVLEKVHDLWMVHYFEHLNPLDVVQVKTIHGVDIGIKRKDVKGALLKRRVTTRQIGRRDKFLWRLSQTGGV